MPPARSSVAFPFADTHKPGPVRRRDSTSSASSSSQCDTTMRATPLSAQFPAKKSSAATDAATKPKGSSAAAAELREIVCAIRARTSSNVSATSTVRPERAEPRPAPAPALSRRASRAAPAAPQVSSESAARAVKDRPRAQHLQPERSLVTMAAQLDLKRKRAPSHLALSRANSDASDQPTRIATMEGKRKRGGLPLEAPGKMSKENNDSLDGRPSRSVKRSRKTASVDAMAREENGHLDAVVPESRTDQLHILPRPTKTLRAPKGKVDSQPSSPTSDVFSAPPSPRKPLVATGPGVPSSPRSPGAEGSEYWLDIVAPHAEHWDTPATDEFLVDIPIGIVLRAPSNSSLSEPPEGTEDAVVELMLTPVRHGLHGTPPKRAGGVGADEDPTPQLVWTRPWARAACGGWVAALAVLLPCSAFRGVETREISLRAEAVLTLGFGDSVCVAAERRVTASLLSSGRELRLADQLARAREASAAETVCDSEAEVEDAVDADEHDDGEDGGEDGGEDDGGGERAARQLVEDRLRALPSEDRAAYLHAWYASQSEEVF